MRRPARVRIPAAPEVFQTDEIRGRVRVEIRLLLDERFAHLPVVIDVNLSLSAKRTHALVAEDDMNALRDDALNEGEQVGVAGKLDEGGRPVYPRDVLRLHEFDQVGGGED